MTGPCRSTSRPVPAEPSPERPVDLHIRGENTDLSILAAIMPGLTDLLRTRRRARRHHRFPRHPEVRRAGHQGGTMTIPATGVTYRDLRGTISFDNDQITIAELSGTDGARGTFEIGGRIEMQELRSTPRHRDERRDLQVIDLSRQDVQVHAALRLTGTTESPSSPVAWWWTKRSIACRSAATRTSSTSTRQSSTWTSRALVDSTSRSKSLRRSGTGADSISSWVTDDAVIVEQHARGALRRSDAVQAALSPMPTLRDATGQARLLEVRQAVHDRGRRDLLLELRS